MELGINTYGLGRLLKASFLQTMQTLKDNGICSIEPCIFFKGKMSGMNTALTFGVRYTDRLGGVWLPGQAREKISLLRSEGFQIEGAHLFGGLSSEDSVDSALTFAVENNLKYYVLSFMTDRIDQAAKQIAMLRRAVRIFREKGVHLLLHNHAIDLKETEGLCVLDFLLNNVPELEVELDLGWAAFAGRDCIAAMEQYREKIRILHFKDMWPGSVDEKPHFCAVGEGRLPLADIMEKAQSLDLFSVGYVIDQDDSENDLMTDVLAGIAHIRAADNPKHGVYTGKLPLSLMTFPMMGEGLRKTLKVEEICEMAAAHGIRRLDLMTAEIPLYGKEKLKTAVKRYGLSLNCLIAFISMASLPEQLSRTLIKKHLKTVKEFQCDKLMLVPMPQFVKLPDDEGKRKAALARVIRLLNEAVAEAEKQGVKVCVEDTPSCNVPLCSIEDCRKVLAAVPGLGLVFDTANMLACGDDPFAFYEELKEYICHVHLKDVIFTDTPNSDKCSNGRFLRCVPWGEGIVPIREICERLAEDAYTGVCAVEYVSPEGKGMIANHKQLERFIRYSLPI